VEEPFLGDLEFSIGIGEMLRVKLQMAQSA
jgi:hypothetical protein